MTPPRVVLTVVVLAAGCVPELQRPPLDDGRVERLRPGELPGGDGCAGLRCPLGCNTALRRCLMLLPSNLAGPDPEILQASAAPKLSGTASLDTDTGEIRDGEQVVRRGGKGNVDGIHWSTLAQSGGHPELALFVLRSLDLAATATLTVTGKRAPVLYLLEDSRLEGTLRAPAAGRAGGPGGYDGGTDGGASLVQPAASCLGGEGQPGGDGPNANDGDGGGGGGGFGAAGGAGGDSDFGSSKPAGGAAGAASATETLSPLRGGCGGGAGGGPELGNSPPGEGGPGGGGGGAVQIAVSGKLQIAGVISVPGAGGGGGSNGAGGGGGGAGGALLLEAVEVTVTGFLAANGGGGGAGGPGPGSSTGQPGEDGRPSLTAASGGKAEGSYGGAGGQGGAAAKLEGSKPAAEANAGGGGGAAGRIRINSSKQPELASAKISGKQSLGASVGTW